MHGAIDLDMSHVIDIYTDILDFLSLNQLRMRACLLQELWLDERQQIPTTMSSISFSKHNKKGFVINIPQTEIKN